MTPRADGIPGHTGQEDPGQHTDRDHQVHKRRDAQQVRELSGENQDRQRIDVAPAVWSQLPRLAGIDSAATSAAALVCSLSNPADQRRAQADASRMISHRIVVAELLCPVSRGQGQPSEGPCVTFDAVHGEDELQRVATGIVSQRVQRRVLRLPGDRASGEPHGGLWATEPVRHETSVGRARPSAQHHRHKPAKASAAGARQREIPRLPPRSSTRSASPRTSGQRPGTPIPLDIRAKTGRSPAPSNATKSPSPRITPARAMPLGWNTRARRILAARRKVASIMPVIAGALAVGSPGLRARCHRRRSGSRAVGNPTCAPRRSS